MLGGSFIHITDPFNAVVSAHAHFAVAGKKDHLTTSAQGDFQREFINQLYLVNEDDFATYLDFSIEELQAV